MVNTKNSSTQTVKQFIYFPDVDGIFMIFTIFFLLCLMLYSSLFHVMFHRWLSENGPPNCGAGGPTINSCFFCCANIIVPLSMAISDAYESGFKVQYLHWYDSVLNSFFIFIHFIFHDIHWYSSIKSMFIKGLIKTCSMINIYYKIL